MSVTFTSEQAAKSPTLAAMQREIAAEERQQRDLERSPLAIQLQAIESDFEEQHTVVKTTVDDALKALIDARENLRQAEADFNQAESRRRSFVHDHQSQKNELRMELVSLQDPFIASAVSQLREYRMKLRGELYGAGGVVDLRSRSKAEEKLAAAVAFIKSDAIPEIESLAFADVKGGDLPKMIAEVFSRIPGPKIVFDPAE